MITRIAPTPSGFLHAGNAINFLLIEKIAKLTGSRILLRIDDLDTDRMRSVYLQDVFDSLEWLGIEWQIGPRDPEDHLRNWSQQFRLARYLKILDGLRELGVLYACNCSRSKLAGLKPHHHECRNAGCDLDERGMSWRIRIDPGTRITFHDLNGIERKLDVHDLIGDTTLRQRAINGSVPMPAYQIASLADDLDRKVSVIVRGADLLPSTAIQLHLASLLGLPEFLRIRFWHHPLIKDADGKKLSKSAGATSLKAMRGNGSDPDVIRAMAGRIFDQMKPIA